MVVASEVMNPFDGENLRFLLKVVYLLRSENSVTSELMSETKKHLTRFENLIRDIFAELGEFESVWEPLNDDAHCDVMVVSKSSNQTYRFDVKVRERITPQMADDLFKRLQGEPLPDHVVRIVYAPVISPRVAEIAGQYGVSHIDSAGNCRIADSAAGLLISRSGIRNEASRQKPKTADPFSTKSSRIIRAMLHEPERGWQVSELAEHPDVKVSKGLVSKVKQTLVRENYAVEYDRLLYLKQPRDLLATWTQKYPGPSEKCLLYMRGEIPEIEERVVRWCKKTANEFALASFSAAWRLAPEVRHSVASIYVGKVLQRPNSLASFCTDCKAKAVDSGANLIWLTPFDQSVFVRCTSSPDRTTSALQTYLDLQSLTGRGEEAAEAVFEKHLRKGLDSAHRQEGSA